MLNAKDRVGFCFGKNLILTSIVLVFFFFGVEGNTYKYTLIRLNRLTRTEIEEN